MGINFIVEGEEKNFPVSVYESYFSLFSFYSWTSLSEMGISLTFFPMSKFRIISFLFSKMGFFQWVHMELFHFIGEKWVFYRFLVSSCWSFTDLSTNAHGIISFYWGKIYIFSIFQWVLIEYLFIWIKKYGSVADLSTNEQVFAIFHSIEILLLGNNGSLLVLVLVLVLVFISEHFEWSIIINYNNKDINLP
jgi:hypothetical protein